MIAEFAIIPDVFDRGSYASPDLAEMCLAHVTAMCREEAIVRDLCNGNWSRHFQQNSDRWHPATKEIIETLGKERRLRPSPRVLRDVPEEHAEWYYEAGASNEKAALDLILAANPTALGCGDDAQVVALQQIYGSKWWQSRSPSIHLQRTTSEYLRALRPVLKRANSFMFIDPHLDEGEVRYKEFSHLLRETSGMSRSPRIEIHFWQGGISNLSDWESRIQISDRELWKAGVTAQVYVWPVKFHDRFLITEIIGIQLGNGFDIATKRMEGTTWNRLGRKNRAEIEFQFEPNAGKFGQPQNFQIGRE